MLNGNPVSNRIKITSWQTFWFLQISYCCPETRTKAVQRTTSLWCVTKSCISKLFIVAFLTTEDSIFYNPNIWKPKETRKVGEKDSWSRNRDCVFNVVERLIDTPPSHNDHLDLVWLPCYDSSTSLFSDSASLGLSDISSNPDYRLRRSAAVTTASTTCGVCDYIYLSALPGTNKENWKWLFVTCLLGK